MLGTLRQVSWTHRTIHSHDRFLDLNFSTEHLCCLWYFDFVCCMPISCEKPLLDFLVYPVAFEVNGPVWSIVHLGILVKGDHPKDISYHTRRRFNFSRANIAEMARVEVLIFLFVDRFGLLIAVVGDRCWLFMKECSMRSSVFGILETIFWSEVYQALTCFLTRWG